MNAESNRAPGRCSDTADHNAPCQDGIEWGLCSTHKSGLDEKLHRLEELERLRDRCRGQEGSDDPCPNTAKAWGLCEKHRKMQEQEILARLIPKQRRLRSSPKQRPIVTKRPPPSTTEEAYARLTDILRRRQHDLDPNEAYTIPFEELRFIESLRVEGPSLIKGDVPVKFQFLEKIKEKTGEGIKEIIVPVYGDKGNKARRDMPLASHALFEEIYACLKLLPGYTERDEHTGEPMKQPLGTIAYKLLRGFNTIDQIRFNRFSPEGKELMRRQEVQEQIPASRKRLPVAPVKIARMLLRAGLAADEVARDLRTLWKPCDLSNQELLAVIRAASMRRRNLYALLPFLPPLREHVQACTDRLRCRLAALGTAGCTGLPVITGNLLVVVGAAVVVGALAASAALPFRSSALEEPTVAVVVRVAQNMPPFTSPPAFTTRTSAARATNAVISSSFEVTPGPAPARAGGSVTTERGIGVSVNRTFFAGDGEHNTVSIDHSTWIYCDPQSQVKQALCEAYDTMSAEKHRGKEQ